MSQLQQNRFDRLVSETAEWLPQQAVNIGDGPVPDDARKAMMEAAIRVAMTKAIQIATGDDEMAA